MTRMCRECFDHETITVAVEVDYDGEGKTRDERPCPLCGVERRPVTFNVGWLLEIANMIGDYDGGKPQLDDEYLRRAVSACLGEAMTKVRLPLDVADRVEDIRENSGE